MRRVVFFIMLFSACCCYSSQPAEDIYNSGLKQSERGNYDEAAALFGAAVSSASKSEAGIVQKAYLARADAYLDGLKLDDAYREYTRFIDKYPKSVDVKKARLGIGLVYYKKNLYDKTREYLLGLLKRYPNSGIAADAQYWLGMLHFKNKNYKKAVQALGAFTRNYPKSEMMPEGLLRLGDSYYGLKKYSLAREAYRKIIKKYPDEKQSEFALYNIGRTYDSEGSVQDSMTIYTQYADKYPSSALSPDVIYRIANYYYKDKQAEKAKKYFKQLYTDFPDNELAEEASFIYAKITYDSGSKQEALNLFKECAQNYGSTGNCYFYSLLYMGNCFMDMDDYKSAADIFEGALKDQAIGPEIAAAMKYNCGVAYENLRQVIKAEKMFNDILYRFPKSIGAAKIYLKRGDDFEHNGDMTAAIENFELAATILKNKDIKSDDLLFYDIGGELGAEAQKRAADCYFTLKQYKDAAREYLKVVYLFSGSSFVPEAQYMAGRAAEESGLLKEAVSEYETVSKKFPDSEWSKKAAEKLELLNGRAGRK